MTRNLAIIQARTGSTRLPGKIMYPLAGRPVLEHVVDRVQETPLVDETIIATTQTPSDDVVVHLADRLGVDAIRGSEANVLKRFHEAAQPYDPDVVIRVTADCPLISPTYLEAGLERVSSGSYDYVSSSMERTFPRGITAEIFTHRSFQDVYAGSHAPHHKEHVTPYYRENPGTFSLYNLCSSEVFDEEALIDRTDLRLTLDEPADYALLHRVFEGTEHEAAPSFRAVVAFIDDNQLSSINAHVDQKKVN